MLQGRLGALGGPGALLQALLATFALAGLLTSEKERYQRRWTEIACCLRLPRLPPPAPPPATSRPVQGASRSSCLSSTVALLPSSI